MLISVLDHLLRIDVKYVIYLSKRLPHFRNRRSCAIYPCLLRHGFNGGEMTIISIQIDKFPNVVIYFEEIVCSIVQPM